MTGAKNVASATFSFVSAVSRAAPSFSLNDTCKKRSQEQPVCPFVNLSAHLLARCLLDPAIAALCTAIEHVLKSSRKWPEAAQHELDLAHAIPMYARSLSRKLKEHPLVCRSAILDDSREKKLLNALKDVSEVKSGTGKEETMAEKCRTLEPQLEDLLDELSKLPSLLRHVQTAETRLHIIEPVALKKGHFESVLRERVALVIEDSRIWGKDYCDDARR